MSLLTVADLPLLSGMSPEQLALVEASAKKVSFVAGERVFAEGQPANSCWLLLRGCVALDVTIQGRGQVVVQTVDAGEVLGWSWLTPPYRWHFGARALEPTAAILLDTGQLRALGQQDPAFGYALAIRLLVVVLDRLQATRARLLDLYGSPHAG